MNKVARIAHADQSEEDDAKRKYKSKINVSYLNARIWFPHKIAVISMIKYACGLDQNFKDRSKNNIKVQCVYKSLSYFR